MWQIFVDTGGTFTDAIGLGSQGDLRRAKVLSSGALRARIAEDLGDGRFRLEQCWGGCDHLIKDWAASADGFQTRAMVEGFDAAGSIVTLERGRSGLVPGAMVEFTSGEESPVIAARIITRTPGLQPLPPIAMRLATTRGTNALLTRSVAPVALFLTRGFGDLLEIGTQQRPDLFAMDTQKPRPIHARVVEVDERLAADGTVLRRPDCSRLEGVATELLNEGIKVAAIAFLHSDINDAHEQVVRERLEVLGFEVVRTSRQVSPFVKLLPRAQTTVIDAALSPIVSNYLSRISTSLAGGRLDVLTSAGGLVPWDQYRAKDSLLSGPAGGVVGAGAAARRAGIHEILAFDMGGTSTDVSRWAGRVEHVFEYTVADATMVSPAAAVHTVAAGGGSICGFDGAALTVGPASAGADPGPACYGRGGPLTVTDVQLLAGRMRAEGFGVPLAIDAAERALSDLVRRMRDGGHREATRARVLDGLLAIAAERIGAAIRTVSTRRGHDPTRAALLAFGGAGGQIACMVAERLGMSRVMIPPDAGLLSARGLAAAPFEHVAQQQVLRPLRQLGAELSLLVEKLTEEALAALRPTLEAIGTNIREATRRVTAAVRFIGQETPVEVEVEAISELEAAFGREYQRIYGYRPDRGATELVWLRVTLGGGAFSDDAIGSTVVRSTRSHAAGPTTEQILRSAGVGHAAPVIQREGLGVGEVVRGPALVVESHCTTVVDAGWRLRVLADGSLQMDHVAIGAQAPSRLGAAEVELFTTRIESIAKAMGEALQRTSFSVNVKERLDYSCAVLDSRARLVACAPHVPVHLGSLGVCVRETLKRVTLSRGDVVVTNHPACGGSHLPDVTVISAAFADGGAPLAYVAARAHHAEIGGIRPGSMPPGATRLIEEGVVIPPTHVVRGGQPCFDGVTGLLKRGPFPTRDLHANIEDINAAVAACARGVADIEALAGACGLDHLGRMLDSIQARSAQASIDTIDRIGTIDVSLTDALDDGSPLHVRVVTGSGTITFDFSGTAGVHPGNLNATPAIVNSCLLYVMRVLAGRDLPLNEGLMRPVTLVLPPGMLNPPFDPEADPASQPAVVGGNVETSQRLVNMLLRGLGVCAESQGTMNNLIFGDANRSYYETICGGAGAGPSFDGASAVHTHMTNTRITDPEILERRYPVRLERFAVRRGSGGAGSHRGGDGIERVIRFLAPMSVSVLTQRRVRGPRGFGEGADGSPGEQSIERADGRVQPLAPIEGVEVQAGDTITMRTPGGGGWSPPGPGPGSSQS